MTSSVDLIHQNMHQRQSIGQLVEPAPRQDQLNLALEAALTAPDHHRLKPTRFVIIPQEQRTEFGKLLSESMRDLEMDSVQIDRAKSQPLRAPLLVVALTELQDHPKVPHYEQILSSGSAIQNFLLSLQVQGFSTIWRTGAVVESALLKKAFHLTERDLVSGIIYIGTAAREIPSRSEINVEQYVSYWQGSK